MRTKNSAFHQNLQVILGHYTELIKQDEDKYEPIQTDITDKKAKSTIRNLTTTLNRKIEQKNKFRKLWREALDKLQIQESLSKAALQKKQVNIQWLVVLSSINV